MVTVPLAVAIVVSMLAAVAITQLVGGAFLVVRARRVARFRAAIMRRDREARQAAAEARVRELSTVGF